MSTTADQADGDATASADAVALIGEAGRLGISLAGRIASEFARGSLPTVNGASPSSGGSVADAPAPGSDVRAALRSAQLEVERALDGALDVLSQAVESYADLADKLVPADGGPDERVAESLLLEVVVGLSTDGALWIHNTTDEATAVLKPWVTDLVAHDSRLLDATVEVEPGVMVPVQASSSEAFRVRVTPTLGARPGLYHGLILVQGMPDAAIHLCVDVEASPE